MANVINNNTLKPTFKTIRKIPQNYHKSLNGWLNSKSIKLFYNLSYNKVTKNDL